VEEPTNKTSTSALWEISSPIAACIPEVFVGVLYPSIGSTTDQIQRGDVNKHSIIPERMQRVVKERDGLFIDFAIKLH
jgi:hypothetical protein